MTQEQLAKQLFVSRTAISKWESARGYPNIESLKAISKLFSISIDQLLSGDELISIAETESKEKTKDMRTTVFGVLDCMTVLVVFLPLFGQQGEHMIEMVSMLSLTEDPVYITAVYIFLAGTTTLWGVLTLALKNVENKLWLSCSTVVSLVLSILGTVEFIISRQPYAAVLVFFMLILKGILLIKR